SGLKSPHQRMAEQLAGLLRVLSVSRQIAIEQGGAGEGLVEFARDRIAGGVRREDQEADDQSRQGGHKTRGELNDVHRLLTQMMLRQPGAKRHTEQRAR